MLKQYLETMRFLSQASDEMMYLCDLASQKVYFTENYTEKYQIPPMDDMAYTLEEMQKFVYAKNGGKISFKLESFASLEGGLLHQEYYVIDCTGKRYRIHSTERLQYDNAGNPRWIIGHISNIATSQRIDALTGLFNAQKLMEDLDECMKKQESGFLIMLGIDNFKNINNKYGRNFGNHILKHMAESLDSLLELSLRAYRLDSDKFAVNAVGYSRKQVENLYRMIQTRVSDQYTLSSGAAEYHPDTLKNAEEIYQHTESALDSAKKNGKNKLEFFSETVYAELIGMIDLQEELLESAAGDFSGFSICYQPLIDIYTCKICGVEALLRYHSPKRGNVPPDELIPVLEQLELIIPVGEWVLRNGLMQCKNWRKHLPELHLNVNMSYSQLRDGSIYEYIVGLLEELQMSGDVLTLELTESIRLEEYPFFNKMFYKFGKKGIKIAIDDFGTGYSSLGYLKSIAIDEIKIDRCFVSGIQHSVYNYRLLGNIIELAHSEGIRVCCEGVETEAELQTIKELHPDVLQGYLFGKPHTIEEFECRYIKKEAGEYRETRQKEQKYCQIKESESSETLHLAKHQKMAAIIDGMDEIVFVRDRDTYEMMYLNTSGREMTGMYDYNGRKCYEVLYGRKTPCEFCQAQNVGNSAYHVWEADNEYQQRHFMIKDKMVEWTGKNAQLIVCIDITEKEIMSKKVQEKLEFEQNIVACTKLLVEEADRDKAINEMLALIGEYYDAKRTFLCNIIDDSSYWTNSHEWCAGTGSRRVDQKSNIPVSAGRNWREMFRKESSFVIENVEYLKEMAPNGYRLMKTQGIRSLIIAPIRKSHEVVGFIIVDTPDKHRTDCGQLETMAYLLADRLVKDDTKDRLNELLSLQHMRQTDMYRAILSETIAYAEIDLETGRILDCGGLWNGYHRDQNGKDKDYRQVLTFHKDDLVYEDDRESYCEFLEFAENSAMGEENNIRKLQFRRRIDGNMRWVEITAHILREHYSGNLYALIYLKNIDAEKKQKLQQEIAANSDPLTGVYNRTAFESEMKKHILSSSDEKESTLIMLDIDNFKIINDKYGHLEGDQVLKQLAEVLKTTFRKRDLIGRLGGDEFLILLKDLTDHSIIDRRMKEFCEAFSKVNVYGSTCSMGLTVVRKQEFSYNEYLRKADVALYKSKEMGKNTYCYYDELNL